MSSDEARSDIPCPLRQAALSAPEMIALDAVDRSMTFRELDDWVEGTSRRLMSKGLRRHDRVALWMENGWQLVVLILAAVRSGLVACPLSTRLPSIDAALKRIDARLVLSDRRGRPPDGFLDRASTSAEIRHHPDQYATIVFTSGSSGVPKAALHSYANHHYSARGSNSNIPLSPGDRWMLSLPLYHVGGIAILFRCLMGRAAVALRPERPLSVSLAGMTHVSLVSTQLLRLLRADAPLQRFTAVLLGGSDIPRGLIEAAVERGWPIHTSYGLTEMASQVTATRPGASMDELRTSGKILPYREVMIGKHEELLVRGETRFIGYIDGGALIEPFDDDGWYATGDVGRFTSDGFLEVVGRIDNLFVSGGENVSPEEIEACLTLLRGVQRAVVVAVVDEEYGHRPVAFVEVVGRMFDRHEIRSHLEKNLPRFKIPDRIFPWPHRNPLTDLKVDRAFFRQEAERLVR